MARKAPKPETPATNVDPHRGQGGCFYNPGGVNHDIESEPDKQLVERTEDRVLRDADEINQPAGESAGDKE